MNLSHLAIGGNRRTTRNERPQAFCDDAQCDAVHAVNESGDGGITINAASGTVRATTLLSAANLSATVGGLVAGTVKVHGNIELSGNADVSKEMLASGNIAVSGNTIKAGTVASGVDFAATDAAAGVLSLRRTGDLTLSARDSVAADTLLGAGNIDVVGDYLTAGTLVSGVDLARTRAGNGEVVLGPQGMITIIATAGVVAAGTLLSAGDLVVSAAKVAVSKVTGHNNVNLAGEVESDQILGAGDVRISGRNVKAGTIASGVDLVATENSSSGAITLSDRGNLTIDATSGKVEAGAILSAGNFTSRSNALTARRVSAHGAVAIDGLP
ncbi:hypothetical protein IB270_30500 [Ensifer sp. ENS05]|uniref:hypothetical protein n=1 Tax=Ensifer sp. ENS05 TaxID=2769277 RepID=UPI001786356C|nr:hypothetical protein [Ensifer sp. ENS05]MBD9597167.1 hypothetical protein [Ensifer sp. ENS05]